jgi:VWFA-related protein
MMKDAASPINRRVIIVVTDNESLVLRGRSGTTIKETLDNLFESGSVVCGLIVRGAIAQVQAVARWAPYNIALVRSYKVDPFAQQTGGEMMNSQKSEVEKKLGDLFEHMRARYSIGFVSTNANYDGKFRNISLKLSPELQKANGELTVRTRRGYYARPQQAKAPEAAAKATTVDQILDKYEQAIGGRQATVDDAKFNKPSGQ